MVWIFSWVVEVFLRLHIWHILRLQVVYFKKNDKEVLCRVTMLTLAREEPPQSLWARKSNAADRRTHLLPCSSSPHRTVAIH